MTSIGKSDAQLDADIFTPSDLGDYEIPGWSIGQQMVAGLMTGIGFLCFCALVWMWSR